MTNVKLLHNQLSLPHFSLSVVVVMILRYYLY